jgi:hypothetical protein
MRLKTHLADLRLHNNAGIRYPLCKSGPDLLNLKATSWPLTNELTATTCKHCFRLALARYPWAYK